MLKKITRIIKKACKGLFMRCVVVFCIVYIVRITERSLNVCETMQISPAAVYGTAVGFFGVELVMCMIKRLYAKNKDEPQDTPTETEGHKVTDGKPLPLP